MTKSTSKFVQILQKYIEMCPTTTTLELLGTPGEVRGQKIERKSIKVMSVHLDMIAKSST